MRRLFVKDHFKNPYNRRKGDRIMVQLFFALLGDKK